jgi:hypothetical protein
MPGCVIRMSVEHNECQALHAFGLATLRPMLEALLFGVWLDQSV